MDTTIIKKQAGIEKNITGAVGNIHLVDKGESGLPVVFVHSFGGSVLHWDHQMKHLQSKRRVVALNLRGHGQSASPSNNDYSVPSLANDIAAVADSLNLKQFILIGHSMGGSSAIAYAGKYPDRVYTG